MGNETMTDPEVIYAIRRVDREPFGYDDYAFVLATGPDDWSWLDEDEDTYPGDYEMLRLNVTAVERRTYPRCIQCHTPATYWGLCEAHAREDDPEYFEEVARHA